jgi:hypothetical protein
MTKRQPDWQRFALLSVCFVLAGSCALPALEKVAAFEDGTAGSGGSPGGKSSGGSAVQSSSGDQSGGGDEGTSGGSSSAGKTNGGGPSGGSSLGGSSTGGAGGEQLGAGGGDDCVDAPGSVEDLLVGDLESSPTELNPPRTGQWFAFASGGTISPPIDQFARSVGGANMTGYSAKVSGSGSSFAGTGFSLNGKQGTCVYDASAYSGITLYYKSTHPLRLVFTTTPRKPINEGGSCASDCSNYHGYALPAKSEWTKVDVIFAMLTQEFGMMDPFRPAELLSIYAQASGVYNPVSNMVDPIVGAFEISLDEVRFMPL